MAVDRTRIWFSLFVLVVFCVGLASGVMIGRRLPPGRPGIGRPFGLGPGGPPGGRRGGASAPLLDRMTTELSLSDGQRAQVDAILRERRDRLDTFRRETNERFVTEQRELRDDIRKLLTPAQQQKFDRLLDEDARGRRGRGLGLRPPGL
jgi:Spy/CpxP family protein refolding chaperone